MLSSVDKERLVIKWDGRRGERGAGINKQGAL
jgi:hypothetical protein